jgi:hypothetical protein
MRSEQRVREHDRDERADAKSSPVTAHQRQALPTWESFPLEDRHRVVNALLQAARRQVETWPWGRSPGQ